MTPLDKKFLRSLKITVGGRGRVAGRRETRRPS